MPSWATCAQKPPDIDAGHGFSFTLNAGILSAPAGGFPGHTGSHSGAGRASIASEGGPGTDSPAGFTLTSPAAVPTPESVASPEPPKPRHSEFEIPPAEPVVTSTESTFSAPSESQTVTATQPDSPPKRTTESTQTRATSFESPPASVATPALTARASEAVETPEPVKQKTETPDERDPFVAKLSSHLSEYLFRETIRVPVDSEGSKTWIAEIELRLMGNGAVTGAKIVKSTDLKDVDAAIYRAALEASPPIPLQRAG